MNAAKFRNYLRWTFCWLLLQPALCLPSLCLAAAVESVTLVYAKPIQQGDSSRLYQVRLLSAALHHAGVEHQLVEADVPMVQDRSLRTVAVENGIDVFWSVTTIEREQLLTPVRFPIDKGLFGWRLLLLSPQTAAKAPDLSSLTNLKKVVFTQGMTGPTPRFYEPTNSKCWYQINTTRCLKCWQQTGSTLSPGLCSRFGASVLKPLYHYRLNWVLYCITPQLFITFSRHASYIWPSRWNLDWNGC